MRILVSLVIVLLLIACSEDQHPLLTDDDKAVALLLDINIANVAMNKYPSTMRDSMSKVFRMQVCELHHLKEEELDTVLWMMQNDFDRYNKLYLRLADTLNALEEKTGEASQDNPRLPYKNRLDSISLNGKN